MITILGAPHHVAKRQPHDEDVYSYAILPDGIRDVGKTNKVKWGLRKKVDGKTWGNYVAFLTSDHEWIAKGTWPVSSEVDLSRPGTILLGLPVTPAAPAAESDIILQEGVDYPPCVNIPKVIGKTPNENRLRMFTQAWIDAPDMYAFHQTKQLRFVSQEASDNYWAWCNYVTNQILSEQNTQEHDYDIILYAAGKRKKRPYTETEISAVVKRMTDAH